MSGDLTFNKIAGAVLATALGLMIIKEVSHGAIHVEETEKFAYCHECAILEDEGPKEEDKPLPFPQESWVLAMDAEKGQKYFQACKTCHTVTAGGDNLQGPNLWNVVGRQAGSLSGYAYSEGMTSKGVSWNYEELDQFLIRPSKYVPGTKMGYSGEKKDAKRAALIEYLRTLSDNPVPRPEPAAAEPEMDKPEMAEGVEGISETPDSMDEKSVEMMKDTTEMADDKMADDKMVDEKMVDGAEEMKDEMKEMATDVVDGAQAAAEDLAGDAGDVMEKAAEVADTIEGEDVMDKAKELVTSDE